MWFCNRFLNTTHLTPFCSVGGGGGNDTVTGAGGGQTTSQPSLSKEQLDSFIASANGMATAVDTLKQLVEARNNAPPLKDGDGDGGDGEPPATVDLDNIETLLEGIDPDTLTNTEMVKLIMKLQRAGFEEAVKPIATELTGLRNGVTREQATRLVQAVAAKHDDFWEWKDEMSKITSEEGIMNPSRLYQLARGDNPKKAAEMDTKYKKEPESRVAGPGARRGFGGLTEVGAQGNSKPGKMSRDDAAEAAWKDVAQIYGDTLSG